MDKEGIISRKIDIENIEEKEDIRINIEQNEPKAGNKRKRRTKTAIKEVKKKRKTTSKTATKKTRKTKKIKKKEKKSAIDECVICLEKFNNDKVKGRLKCKHIFCFGCIREWSKTENSCPLCKVRFKSIAELKPEGRHHIM